MKQSLRKKGGGGKQNMCGMKIKGELLKMEELREGGDRMIEVRRGQQKTNISKMPYK